MFLVFPDLRKLSLRKPEQNGKKEKSYVAIVTPSTATQHFIGGILMQKGTVLAEAAENLDMKAVARVAQKATLEEVYLVERKSGKGRLHWLCLLGLFL